MLYKFMGGTEAELVDVFKKAVIDGSLKFTGACHLNDPCELRFESVRPTRQQFDSWHKEYASERSTEELENAWRAFHGPSFDFNTNIIPRQDLMSSCYLLCLSHSWDDPTMWAHYASNRSGFVVVYRDELVSEIAKLSEHGFSGSVNYSDEIPKLRWFSAPPAQLTSDLLSTKGLTWKNEDEFRVILAGPSGHESLFRNITTSIVAGVIIGHRASDSIIKIANSHRSQHGDFSIHFAHPSIMSGKMALAGTKY